MRKIFALTLLALMSISAYSQDTIQQPAFGQKKRIDNMNATYHRSSLYDILLFHKDQQYAEEILGTYYVRPKSEKFNDHSLDIDVVSTTGKKYASFDDVNEYMMNSNIANDLVAKWFNRNESTGYCDMSLVYTRAMQGASTEMIETSELAKLGQAILLDSGTDLIGNTYVLVHDIIYIDKGERNKNAAEGVRFFGSLLRGVGRVMTVVTGDNSFNELGKSVDELSKSTADMVDDFEGFRVKIQTHLYRLNWQHYDSDFFYENYYLDEYCYDQNKFDSWQNADYQLSYVGTQESVCGQTVMVGTYDLSQLMKIVVYRTLDECVVKLQRNYEEFKVKEPIYEIDENGYVIAKIGMKEGVSNKSKYEVLEKVETSGGTIKYKKVGVLKPVKGMIWDNRYLAFEDGAENSDLKGTYFKVKKGKDLYPGLLIREIKF